MLRISGRENKRTSEEAMLPASRLSSNWDSRNAEALLNNFCSAHVKENAGKKASYDEFRICVAIVVRIGTVFIYELLDGRIASIARLVAGP